MPSSPRKDHLRGAKSASVGMFASYPELTEIYSCPLGFLSDAQSFSRPKAPINLLAGRHTPDSAAARSVPGAALPAEVLLPRHEAVIYNVRRNSRTKLTKQHFIKSNKTVFSRKFNGANCSEPSSPPCAAQRSGEKEDVRTADHFTGLL